VLKLDALLNGESDDGLLLSSIEDFEVYFLQIAHGVTLLVSNHHGHQHDIHAAFEAKAAVLIWRMFGRLGMEEGTQEDASSAEDAASQRLRN
jgi:hypothetical protein